MDRIARAATFFEEHGREIDRARFRLHFLGGDLDEVMGALGRYQNADGGFGHGLEPDVSAPDSNPFAVELALIMFFQDGIPAQHDMVRKTVAYLESSQDEDGNWRFTPGVYEHRLAPWFQGWQWPNLNPSCSLAGHLRRLGLGSERLHARVEKLFHELSNPSDLLGGEYYAVRPYAYYFLPEWEHPQRELWISGVLWWLIRQEHDGNLADAGHFFDYVREPDSFTGRLLPARIVDEQLDRLESEQQEDGGWPSPYDESWRGPSTVENLLTLRRFGRL